MSSWAFLVCLQFRFMVHRTQTLELGALSFDQLMLNVNFVLCMDDKSMIGSFKDTKFTML